MRRRKHHRQSTHAGARPQCKARALARIALVLLALLPAALPDPLAAQTSEPIPAASAQILAERRIAAGYVRTGNADLTALALERLAKALQGSPQAQLAADALAAIDAADLPRAAELIERLGDRLAQERRRAGVRVLADCVREASRAYQALDIHRLQRPDLAVPATRTAIADAARASEAAFARCNTEAPAAVKDDPDFRRLIDGARASLAKVPGAVETSDSDLLHRLLIELRAFEQLLLFRFG